ncbi:MAG: aminotransferase class I/II-fold pyridoxal phosphate-dependent enzyme [Clostridia bacterium]|nr:aminotransferase class I/II-fold pyridoxal phosphate-dependent enzyme [Clostridia bacterium]
MTKMKIYDNLYEFAHSGAIRFYMPGHKGGRTLPESFLSPVMPYDVTELKATDDLFDPKHVILESQRALAGRFGVMAAHYLTGGSTLGIYAALSLSARPGGRVLLDRGCHKSVIDAMVLLGLRPVFLNASLTAEGVLSPVSPVDVYTALEKNPDVSAVFITSPSYYGLCAQIETIHAVTDAAGAALIVDAAHGGNMLFMNRLPLCAEFTVVSLHKTLPALTGAAVLFSNKYAPEEITKRLSLFSTSSPSHLILASAEKCITYMDGEGRETLYALAERSAYFTAWLDISTPFTHIEEASSDLTRIVIHTGRTSLSGYALYGMLEDEFSIICEMADDENVVLIPSVANTQADFDALLAAMAKIAPRVNKRFIPAEAKSPEAPVLSMDMREAYFADRETLSAQRAEGRVSCETLTRYPPGIPYLIPGQLITRRHTEEMMRLGVKKVSVVK